MGWLKKLIGATAAAAPQSARPPVTPAAVAQASGDARLKLCRRAVPDDGRGFVFIDGDDEVEVRGEAHCQAALEAYVGGKCSEGYDESCVARLVREADNQYDANAVMVLLGNQKVGYIARELAADVGALIDSAGDNHVVCAAYLRGGWDRGGGDTGQFGIQVVLPGAR